MSDETAATKIDNDEEVQELLDALDDADPAADPDVEHSDHSKRILKAAAVVPILDATQRKKRLPRRGPGRPKKVAPKVSREDLQYHQEVMAEQAEFVDGDEIVKATRDRSSSLETLQLVKERLAIGGATLDFARIELQKRGALKDVPQVISRQIAAMKEIANIELQISQFQASVFNLRDERLQKVFAMLIESFRDVLKEMLSHKEFDLVWNRLETQLEGWEDRAEDLVR